MVVLFRIMMMFAGYSAACIAASLVLALGTLGPDWNGLFADLGFHSAHAQSAAMWVDFSILAWIRTVPSEAIRSFPPILGSNMIMS